MYVRRQTDSQEVDITIAIFIGPRTWLEGPMRADKAERRWKGALFCHGDCHVLGAVLVWKLRNVAECCV